jgi:Heterokaryon incompatibility protein (HET)
VPCPHGSPGFISCFHHPQTTPFSAHCGIVIGDQQIYSPLSKETSIRLLKIAPANRSDGIEYDLVLVDSLENPPIFEALSYAWGDLTMAISISCNGIAKAVTTNLAAALLRLRMSSGFRPRPYGVLDFLSQSRSRFGIGREVKLPSFAKRLRHSDRILSSSVVLVWIDTLCTYLGRSQTKRCRNLK